MHSYWCLLIAQTKEREQTEIPFEYKLYKISHKMSINCHDSFAII